MPKSLSDIVGDKPWKLVSHLDLSYIKELENFEISNDTKNKIKSLSKQLISNYPELKSPEFYNCYSDSSFQVIFDIESSVAPAQKLSLFVPNDDFNEAFALNVSQKEDEWFVIDVAHISIYQDNTYDTLDSYTYIADGEWGLEKFLKDLPL